MSVPPIITNMYEALVGIFTGTIRITFLVILVLFITKFLWDLITDWLFKNIKKYLNYLAFPGAFMHQLFHSLAIKMLGYKVKVNFHMSFSLRDVTSQSLSGELKNVWHAWIIGVAPIFNFAIAALLIHFHPDFKEFFIWIDFPYGQWIIAYLIFCFIYFGMPDFSDLMLPFTTLTARHVELVFLLIAGFFCFVIAVGVWGWLIPLINFLLYCIVLIYLAQKQYFERRFKQISRGFDVYNVEKKEQEQI